jgi:hypothetical protein
MIVGGTQTKLTRSFIGMTKTLVISGSTVIGETASGMVGISCAEVMYLCSGDRGHVGRPDEAKRQFTLAAGLNLTPGEKAQRSPWWKEAREPMFY